MKKWKKFWRKKLESRKVIKKLKEIFFQENSMKFIRFWSKILQFLEILEINFWNKSKAFPINFDVDLQ